ncbi:kinase-like domain-containing protein [Hysterangium stoloniferum]|nr:kinase-like domain-containing protein [Hysterangium stoloniferum]
MVKVMETRERHLGPLHRETLNAQQSLAMVSETLGRYDNAKRLGVQVMKTRERLLGPLHPEASSAKEILATTYEAMGRYREPEKLRMQVLDKKPEKLKTSSNSRTRERFTPHRPYLSQGLSNAPNSSLSYGNIPASPPTAVQQAMPFSKNSNLCLDGRITQRSTHSVAGGGSADIWTGKLGDTKVAIKILRWFSSEGVKIRHDKLMRRAWREYLAWSSLSHPNNLNCLGYSFRMGRYIASNPENNRIHLITGISSALVFLHHHNPPIVHGDIRAANILVSDKGVPCLTDLGLSRFVDDVARLSTSSNVGGS